ncbi:MAG: MBL fold metallo-hydrolase [Acidobacteria bacterium]|nr:MBL fold metallo-hydrolase [Acidobacteriota bacterium]
MKAISLFFSVAFFILLLFSPAGRGEELTLERVSANLYLIYGGGGNVAFLVTEEGVLVVDSKTFPYQGEEVVAKIRQVTKKPIRYLIFTHYHGDHIQGAQSFPESAVVISHINTLRNIERFSLPGLERAKKRYGEELKKVEQKVKELREEKSPKLKEAEKELELIQRRLKEYQRLRLVSPEVVFERKMIIRFGGEDVELLYSGCGHTDGDILVYFPKEKAIHMGDLLFNNIIPYIDRRASSDTENWIKILEKVMTMDGVEKVIPGHGKLTDKKGLIAQADYLKDLRAEVKKYIERGASLEETKEKLKLPKYEKMEGYTRRLSANVEAVYKEMTKKE